MEHYEYWLSVDGAYEADIVVDCDGQVIASNDPGSSPTTLDEWLESLDADHQNFDGNLHYAVYRISHGDHEYGEECECAQYETDHSPIREWGQAS